MRERARDLYESMKLKGKEAYIREVYLRERKSGRIKKKRRREKIE